eukprot:6814190-Alexandrium_andersonii.AAC.1
MSASLVGSEMCIRDSGGGVQREPENGQSPRHTLPTERQNAMLVGQRIPVSYTHLTLPTICSV